MIIHFYCYINSLSRPTRTAVAHLYSSSLPPAQFPRSFFHSLKNCLFYNKNMRHFNTFLLIQLHLIFCLGAKVPTEASGSDQTSPSSSTSSSSSNNSKRSFGSRITYKNRGNSSLNRKLSSIGSNSNSISPGITNTESEPALYYYPSSSSNNNNNDLLLMDSSPGQTNDNNYFYPGQEDNNINNNIIMTNQLDPGQNPSSFSSKSGHSSSSSKKKALLYMSPEDPSPAVVSPAMYRMAPRISNSNSNKPFERVYSSYPYATYGHYHPYFQHQLETALSRQQRQHNYPPVVPAASSIFNSVAPYPIDVDDALALGSSSSSGGGGGWSSKEHHTTDIINHYNSNVNTNGIGLLGLLGLLTLLSQVNLITSVPCILGLRRKLNSINNKQLTPKLPNYNLIN
jgi:hypothetical protein